MLDREWFSGATHAGHDFIGDEQDSALMTDFGDALDVTVGWNSRAECGANNGLEDECGHCSVVVCGEKRLEIVGAGDVTARKCFVKRTVIAETGRDVSPFLKKRLIGDAASDVSADRHRAQGAAVITLAAGNNAKSLRSAGFKMELACDFNRRFGGFGASRREVDATVSEIGWREPKQPRG